MKTRLATRVETAVTYISLVLLILFFGIIFYQNFFFTESFDLLILREMDDMAFHSVLRNMRDRLFSGHWQDFFATVEYGYGNIFWSLLTVLTLPVFLLQSDTWSMALPREISWLAYVLSFFIFYKIARLLNYKRAETLLVCLFLASLGIGISAASRFHNNTIVLCLILCAVYLALRPFSRDKKIQWPPLLLGLAMAIKLTAFFFVPVLILILNRDLDWKSLRQEWKSRLRLNFKYGLNLVAAFLVGFTPTTLLAIFGNGTWKDSFYLLKTYIRRSSDNLGGSDFSVWQNLQYSFFSYHISYWLLALLVAVALGAVWKRKFSTRLSEQLPSLLFFTSVILLLIMAMKVKNGPIYLGFYSLPLVFLLSLMILEVQTLTRHSLAAVAFLCGLGIYHNYPCFRDNIDYYQKRFRSETIQAQIQEFNKVQNLNLMKESDRLIIDFRTVFPTGQIRSLPSIAYYFSDFKGLDWENRNLFVFDPKIKEEVKKCVEQIPENRDRCTQISDLAIGVSPFKTVYESSSLLVIRRE